MVLGLNRSVTDTRVDDMNTTTASLLPGGIDDEVERLMNFNANADSPEPNEAKLMSTELDNEDELLMKEILDNYNSA